mmetsp:Transcript_1249/g.5340  ORF Transcript_1249/g.5340 Transcript_1249/m.5340 type:complete len:266 (-) Transcript_1249:1028-1825(-)
MELQHLRQRRDQTSEAFGAEVALPLHVVLVVPIEHIRTDVALQSLIQGLHPEHVEGQVLKGLHFLLLEVGIRSSNRCHRLPATYLPKVHVAAPSERVYEEPDELLRVLLDAHVDAKIFCEAVGLVHLCLARPSLAGITLLVVLSFLKILWRVRQRRRFLTGHREERLAQGEERLGELVGLAVRGLLGKDAPFRVENRLSERLDCVHALEDAVHVAGVAEVDEARWQGHVGSGPWHRNGQSEGRHDRAAHRASDLLPSPSDESQRP